MAIDIFAKLGSIKGESADAKHKDEIEVLSYSWGISQAPAGGGDGAAAGKANVHDISIVHVIDKATPLLLRACATGEHLKDATISHRKAGKSQQDYLVIKLNDVTVTAVSHGASSGGDFIGTESVSLRFAKVDFSYKAQKADGSLDAAVSFKYDVANHKVL